MFFKFYVNMLKDMIPSQTSNNKGCGMVHIKGIAHVVEQQVSSLVTSLVLYRISDAYNFKYNVLSALLNKTYPSSF